jgi:hypothetical protein
MSGSASLGRALLLYSAAAFAAFYGNSAPPAETVHIDSTFDSGQNRYEWRSARTGTCGPGTSTAKGDRFRLDGLAPVVEDLVDEAAFSRGHVELRAVAGSSRSERPDECAVILYTLLGSESGVVHNGGSPRADVDLTVRFRHRTESSVLTFFLAFGDSRWRYIALMVPASGIATVPYLEPGRIGLMEPMTDLQGDNAPLKAGEPATLRVEYRRAGESVAVYLDGRRIVFSHVLGGGPRPILVPKRVHEVDDYPRGRLVPRPAALLALYSEAQLDSSADSHGEILAVRLVSRDRPSLREAAARVAHRLARPFFAADLNVRYLLGRLRRKASVLAGR